MQTFKNFDLLPSLQATLHEKEFVTPTEIQSRAVPLLLEGRTIVAVAETGSGKTLAYALPILHQLKSLENEGKAVSTEASPRAVVVVPTRELGEQVSKVFKPFTHTTRLRVRALLGGTTFEVARRSVKGSFEVLVATPGRLVKLLDMGLLSLGDVRVLVFDEADQMLDKGFLPDAKKIVGACPAKRQLALFSATVSPSVEKLMKELFSGATVIRSEGSHRVVSGLKTKHETVFDGKRFPLLEQILDVPVQGGTIIFTNTRAQCDKLAGELEKAGKACVVYRGEMDKVERRRNLKAFREGKIDLLISTDLASRGLDVDHVGRVINYHLPQQMENYLHRVGRTARAGREGVVINFVTERDEEFVAKLGTVDAAPKGEKAGKSSGEAWPEAPNFKKIPKIIAAGGPIAPLKIMLQKRAR
ncbi:MAG: DEAD/DEAH box helicase [Cryobacterium sp.]|nr:DEAD/DEAH box helicase [Oligoflexia bacterium]